MTIEGSGDRVLVIPKTKSPGPRAGCLATLTVFARGEGPAEAWQAVETRHLRWPEGPHPEQRMWECTVLPAPSQKGLGRGKDKTWKNVKCGDSTPAV